MYENFDLTSIVTPVRADVLDSLLRETAFDDIRRRRIVKGFSQGFSLGYRGQRKNIRRFAPNLKFRIGNKIELWNKVMKEVKMKRYAGPFEEVPFKNFIQSPIGLVPKDQGKDTRLIFHLSYPRTGKSVNSETPERFCKVKYPDFNDAVTRCLEEMEEMMITGGENPIIFTAKTDLKSAFRVIPLKISQFMLLVMKAENPENHKIYYFVDKCLPFGASISCKIFQDFSDCLSHIQSVKSGKKPINYLDDFFFAAFLRSLCNHQLDIFLNLCQQIGFPVSLEKTVRATTMIVFLGLLIDGKHHIVGIPVEKVWRALNMINEVLDRKKLQLIQLQRICGYLNFLCKSIIPGRAFTRRLYSNSSGVLKPHHHIRINREMRLDFEMWRTFLNNQ